MHDLAASSLDLFSPTAADEERHTRWLHLEATAYAAWCVGLFLYFMKPIFEASYLVMAWLF